MSGSPDFEYIYNNLSVTRSLYSNSLGYYKNLDDVLYHLSLTINDLGNLGDLSDEQKEQLSKILKEGQEEISKGLGGLTDREERIEIITTGFKNLNSALEDFIG